MKKAKGFKRFSVLFMAVIAAFLITATAAISAAAQEGESEESEIAEGKALFESG
ncbi:hypothetical protein HYU17_03795, partial [Candidatus Woesearchaeota archaeon]|nr:hypothetical protein [Candidatus Woesearchaeota archaeon]